MAIEEYRIWAGIDAPDGGQVGTTVGTQVAVASSSGLLWYLKKAGLQLAPPTPLHGRRYPTSGLPVAYAYHGPAPVAEALLEAVEPLGEVTLGAAGMVVSLEVSAACRVRVYRTEAERTADAARPFTTPYTAEAGLLYDYLAAGPIVDAGRPWKFAGGLFWRVDGGPVDVTIRYVTTGVE